MVNLFAELFFPTWSSVLLLLLKTSTCCAKSDEMVHEQLIGFRVYLLLQFLVVFMKWKTSNKILKKKIVIFKKNYYYFFSCGKLVSTQEWCCGENAWSQRLKVAHAGTQFHITDICDVWTSATRCANLLPIIFLLLFWVLST